MCIVLSFIVFIHACIYCNAQKIPKRELTIGDTLPDVEINNIVNYKAKSVKASDFKGKLLILDFWATCVPLVFKQCRN